LNYIHQRIIDCVIIEQKLKDMTFISFHIDLVGKSEQDKFRGDLIVDCVDDTLQTPRNILKAPDADTKVCVISIKRAIDKLAIDKS